MGTEPKPGEGEAAPPWSEVSETELHALVDDVLRSGKHLTIPANGGGSANASSERLHAKAIAEQMRRLAHRIRADEPEPEDEGPDDVDEWWFELDGKRLGPISLRKVRYLWEDGELTPDSLCWHEGFSTWVSLFRVSELAEALAPRPAGSSPQQVKEAARVPKIDCTTASGSWMPSAAEALHAANRLRLAATQQTAPAPEPTRDRPIEAPPPMDQAGTFVTLSVEKPAPAATSESKRRGGLLHALATGLVAGGLIAAAVVGTRLLWPQPPTQPLVVVVHDARSSEVPLAREKAKPPAPKPVAAKTAPAAVRRAKPEVAAPPAPKPPVRAAAVETPARKTVPTVDEAFAEQFGTTPDELESSEIAEVVAAHRAQVDGCIRSQRAAAPDDSGRLVMQWKVSLDGRVSDVRVQSQALRDSALGKCLTGEIAGWRFPEHEVAHGPVEFPFVY